ncbi:MAG: hypothetical protein ACHQ53_14340 [Polyangiales bacterium]
MRAPVMVGWSSLFGVVLALGCGATASPSSTSSKPKSSSSSTTGGVPCDVANVVSNNCTLCHAATPKFGALMPLMTFADFHAAAKTDSSRKVYEVIPDRINATDITRRMPPASRPALSTSDLGVLDDWVKAGAVASKQSCTIKENGSSSGSTGGAAGSGGSMSQATVGSGGIENHKIEYDDPLMKCYQFLAHADGDKMQPYPVPTTPDLYMNFEFASPWTGMMYARSYASSIDNMAVVHHWLFYKNDMGNKANDGTAVRSTGAHPGGQLVNGWAPGSTPSYFDPDVGTEMADTATYTLEIHYNNKTGSIANDSTGLEVCVTPTEPKYVATVSWLGTDNINGTQASGTCTPVHNERIHIIGANPHMHLKGNRMQVVLNRADGSMETIHDQPFDFNYQIGYGYDVWVEPGDSITTTCYYSAPATFGQSTTDEMCYWFAMAYPKLALTNSNPIAMIIHGPNTCLQ